MSDDHLNLIEAVKIGNFEKVREILDENIDLQDEDFCKALNEAVRIKFGDL